MRIGVLGAMPEEVSAVLGMLGEPIITHAGGRDYSAGTHAGHEAVAVHSRIGKVAAASAAVELISRFGVEQIVFTGLAGGLDPGLRVGDVVIGEGLVQHDMDASPLFPALEVPLTGRSRFESSPEISAALTASAGAAIDKLGLGGARVVLGDIATGDRFISGDASREAVRRLAPAALCVEMEGAAVAQVCEEYGVPFGIVRMISDSADHSAASDFAAALAGRAAAFAEHTVAGYLESLAT